jgi:hypothetical protein
MADITIGGKIPAALLGKFLAELDSTGAKVGSHGGGESGAGNAEQLRRVLDGNGHLPLTAEDVRAFEGLEGFCMQHDIPFDRHSATGNACFRPGMRSAMSPDQGGEALLDAGTIRPIAKEVARLVTVRLTREKLLAAAAKVIRHLNSLLPPEIEPLPPLKIEE